MTDLETLPPPRSLRIVAFVALAWNLLGVAMFVLQANPSAEDIAAMPAAQRDVVEAMPVWGEIAFGTAVFAGLFGALGLLLRRSWAVPMFAVSLLALLAQIAIAYLMAPSWAAYGPAGLAMPVLLVVIAGLLLGYARHALRRRWLR